MNRKKTGIVAECVCDLPKNTLKNYEIDILYFLIETESGIFTDTDEITAENIISYMETGGGKSKSSPPPVEQYVQKFEKNLEQYDEVVMVTISSKISQSFATANHAVQLLGEKGKRVRVFDSGHLSSGLGFMVMKAAETANIGFSADEIVTELELYKERVCTSFITRNADYLYRNDLVPKAMKIICSKFNIHPVLTMKNGNMVLKTVLFGNYETACKYYVRTLLKNVHDIDKRCAFITHVGCGVKLQRLIQSEVEKYYNFNKINLQTASATISGNCGPGTFGVLFVRN